MYSMADGMIPPRTMRSGATSKAESTRSSAWDSPNSAMSDRRISGRGRSRMVIRVKMPRVPSEPTIRSMRS